jgi:hypothetical protein
VGFPARFFSNLVGILRVLFEKEDLQGFGNLAGSEA